MRFSNLRLITPAIILSLAAFFLFQSEQTNAAPETKQPAAPKPLRALLIAGGCCHDYEKQIHIISKGIHARANMRVDVVWTRDTSHTPPFPLFQDPNWAKDYDLIIHDECAGRHNDDTILKNILKAHETVPAVHLHCAIHSFRTDAWTEHLGIQSNRHGPHVPVSLEIKAQDHPITKPLKDWVTGKEELYNNVEIHDITPLILGTQTYKHGKEEKTDVAIVAWTNTKSGAPSFSTTLGHFNENVADPRYLTLITRGALWACGKIDDPLYHLPYTGENKITEIKALSETPTPVKLSAISTQVSNNNLLAHAIDRDPNTRWCANKGDMPAWFQIEFDQPTEISGAEIDWEIPEKWTQYTLQTSLDGKTWNTVVNAAKNTKVNTRHLRSYFKTTKAKFIKLNILGTETNSWPSFYDIRLYRPDGIQLNLTDAAKPVAPVAQPTSKNSW